MELRLILLAATLLTNPLLVLCLKVSGTGTNIWQNDFEVDRTDLISRTRKRKKFRKRSLIRNPNERQANVWNMIKNDMESHKFDNRIYARSIDGRKTFSSFHYIVLPIYWNGQVGELYKMNMAGIEEALKSAANNYASQSFGRFQLTYELLEQKIFSISSSTRVAHANQVAQAFLKNLGYTRDSNYDGILLIYNTLGGSGDFCCRGGKAFISGKFASVSYETNTSTLYRVIRHEIGHNFGHYHHMHNHYNYRNSRPEKAFVTDGFDMMSGGNAYERSDFSVGSKWFYNWVSEKHIVSMQPEGPTAECPSCVSSGTFKLNAFDDWWKPLGDNDLRGIHIPIMTTYYAEWDMNVVFSYWLSLRTGVNGLLNDGLSVHMAEFELQDGLKMGYYFDSMNYDVFGYSDDRTDSVVLEDTCYHVSPAPYLLDIDLIAASAVQPVVCVDSVNVGHDITVSVSFINPDLRPKPTPNVKQFSMDCATSYTSSKTFELGNKDMNLFHVKGTGDGGRVAVALSSESGWSTAYFYDGYPYSPMMYGSDAAYGSMKRLGSSSKPSCTTGFSGAQVVKITSSIAKPLGLNEIEIIDENGVNVALKAKCYSSSSNSTAILNSGDPKCLNDGDIGNLPESCISQSAKFAKGNFDFCVLAEPIKIREVTIHPARGPGMKYLTNYLRRLRVDVYIEADGISAVRDYKNVGSAVSFKGLVASHNLVKEFGSNNKKPITIQLNLPDISTGGCEQSSNAMSMTYTSLFGELYTVIPPYIWGQEGERVFATISCRAPSCMANEYNANGRCNRCPPNYRASRGSTSMNQCWPCPAGSYLSHPFALECSIDNRSETDAPTKSPIKSPTNPPVRVTSAPTQSPVRSPTESPTQSPVRSPTESPIRVTASPVKAPALNQPVQAPIDVIAMPTRSPTTTPTAKKTDYPTVTPPKECEEDPRTLFLLKMFGVDMPIARNCNFLGSIENAKRTNICSRTERYKHFLPAKEACPKSCQTCGEDANARFLVKVKTTQGGQRKPVKRTCNWLSNKPTSRVQKLCKKSTSFRGFHPAKVVCPDTCSAHLL